jgi:hypothetical protein
MDKIELLLKELDNRVPKSVGLKLDEYYDLCDRLEVAEEELKENPSEDNQAKFDEVNEFVSSMYDKLVSSLTKLVEEKKAKEKEGTPAPEPQPAPASTDGKPAEQVDDKDKDKDKDKKKGMSVFGVVLGVTLLVATAGAYNYFSKNK